MPSEHSESREGRVPSKNGVQRDVVKQGEIERERDTEREIFTKQDTHRDGERERGRERERKREREKDGYWRKIHRDKQTVEAKFLKRHGSFR